MPRGNVKRGRGINPRAASLIGMEPKEITPEDLEQFAAALAKALPDLDCPECCDQGWRYQYMERSAALFQDEWEWHCLAHVIVRYRHTRQSR